MLFFFFKQKTAYEMRISDWSSDVCSSDLELAGGRGGRAARLQRGAEGDLAIVLVEDILTPEFNRPTLLRSPDADTGVEHRIAVLPLFGEQIGRASCRERVCQYV